MRGEAERFPAPALHPNHCRARRNIKIPRLTASADSNLQVCSGLSKGSVTATLHCPHNNNDDSQTESPGENAATGWVSREEGQPESQPLPRAAGCPLSNLQRCSSASFLLPLNFAVGCCHCQTLEVLAESMNLSWDNMLWRGGKNHTNVVMLWTV